MIVLLKFLDMHTVPLLHHSVQLRMVVDLWHQTEHWQPSQHLFTTHCVHFWVVSFHCVTTYSTWHLLSSWLWICRVSMGFITSSCMLLKFLGSGRGYWPPLHCLVAHVVIWQTYLLPGFLATVIVAGFIVAGVIVANADSIRTRTIRNTCQVLLVWRGSTTWEHIIENLCKVLTAQWSVNFASRYTYAGQIYGHPIKMYARCLLVEGMPCVSVVHHAQ